VRGRLSFAATLADVAELYGAISWHYLLALFRRTALADKIA
jgi:hypothetical protein